MRYVTALFDAPQPAGMALHLLRELGFEDRDLILLPELPAPVAGDTEDPWTAGSETSLEDERTRSSSSMHDATPSPPGPEQVRANARHRLQQLGLPEPTASLATEGLDRGALVLVARVPNLSAAVAAQAMETAGALPAERTVRLWSKQPELRYRWSELAAPEVVTDVEVDELERGMAFIASPEARPEIAQPSIIEAAEPEVEVQSAAGVELVSDAEAEAAEPSADFVLESEAETESETDTVESGSSGDQDGDAGDEGGDAELDVTGSSSDIVEDSGPEADEPA